TGTDADPHCAGCGIRLHSEHGGECMRSLYLTVLLAMLVTLSVSLAVFVAISDRVTKQFIYPVFEAMDELELESARNAWEAKGAPGLAAYVERLNHHFGTAHYILNADGVDLVSGQNRRDLLPPSPATTFRGGTKQGYLVTHRSSDGRLWLVAVDPRQPQGWS